MGAIHAEACDEFTITIGYGYGHWLSVLLGLAHDCGDRALRFPKAEHVSRDHCIPRSRRGRSFGV